MKPLRTLVWESAGRRWQWLKKHGGWFYLFVAWTHAQAAYERDNPFTVGLFVALTVIDARVAAWLFAHRINQKMLDEDSKGRR